jgi:hypothetical protein
MIKLSGNASFKDYYYSQMHAQKTSSSDPVTVHSLHRSSGCIGNFGRSTIRRNPIAVLWHRFRVDDSRTSTGERFVNLILRSSISEDDQRFRQVWIHEASSQTPFDYALDWECESGMDNKCIMIESCSWN